MNEVINSIIMDRYAKILRNRAHSFQEVLDTQKQLTRKLEELAEIDKILDSIRTEMMPNMPVPGVRGYA